MSRPALRVVGGTDAGDEPAAVVVLRQRLREQVAIAKPADARPPYQIDTSDRVIWPADEGDDCA
jgi:hypothetical protein